jgi:hypothetical protein
LKQNPQRFSGRELAALLSQVRDELGDEATIVEANRLRRGGIGGFFAKECFEVVAAPSTSPPPSGPMDAPSGAVHLDGLLDRAELVSTGERLTAAGGRPSPSAEGRSADPFREVLRGAIVDLTEPDQTPAARAGAPVEPDEVPSTIADGSPPPAPTGPQAPQPTHRDRSVSPPPERRPSTRPVPFAGRPMTVGGFWGRLARFERMLDPEPLAGNVTAVVGPLDDALGVARRLAAHGGVAAGDLTVATDRGQVAGIPPWQVVDDRPELVERVRYWRGHGGRAVVVVDLDVGMARAARLLSLVAADLTRLVVPDLSDPVALAETLRALGPVTAIDISRPPEPALLLQLVEHGVRVATVCGRPLTAELLAGLAAWSAGE